MWRALDRELAASPGTASNFAPGTIEWVVLLKGVVDINDITIDIKILLYQFINILIC